MASPAYMTMTFSQVWATTPRSWVMRIMEMCIRDRHCTLYNRGIGGFTTTELLETMD